MSTAIFSLTSPLHSEKKESPSEEAFIKAIEAQTGEDFVFQDDFRYFGSYDRNLIYIRTGGTEGLFKSLSLNGHITLLTSGQSNSLAASMEILSYLRQNGQSGEIIHGTAEQIADMLRNPATVTEDGKTAFVNQLAPTNLGGARLGVIGKPSDWLISSNVDYDKAKRLLNVELVDIPIGELVAEIKAYHVELRSFEGSEAIYEALKKIVARYGLGGLTLRCFDLLDSVHNTGCLALARLNAEGIPSSCEGDVPALLSMLWLQKTRNCPGFQCNLSRIDGDELLFAHCTVPLQMTRSYSYTTHFESGIGTAIKGEMQMGKVEIFKISPDLEHYVSIPGTIIRNESKADLCRTQIVVNAPGAASYFLRAPLANHHIISYL